MKSFGFLLLFTLIELSVNGENICNEFRECPTGYNYVGDDGTPQSDELGRIVGECGESPTYSCYKPVDVTDINDALGQCYKSVMDSDNMEARVVSFDDDNELFRVFKYYYNFGEGEGEEQKVLTSAMKFAVNGSEDAWIYLGTNYTISEKIENDDRTDLQCLAVTGVINDGYNKTSIEPRWEAVSCLNNPMGSLCEIRVKTVTYFWVPNWLSITLIILTIILLVTCCMAALSYTKYKPTTTRAYRANGQSNTTANNYPANDAPPKYSDVTGISTSDSQQKAFDKYKNKGKELLAKIYVVRDN